jgi:dUTP pyrophosphatase
MMTDTVQIKVKKLVPEAKLPTYSTDGAACADVYALNSASILPRCQTVFRTGQEFELPPGWLLAFRPRRALSGRSLSILPNSPGTLDEDYRGEAMVCLYNLNYETTMIEEGDRIAQVRPVRVTKAEFEVVDELSETKRGAGGFGSTGR